jgi:hypothetical protein
MQGKARQEDTDQKTGLNRRVFYYPLPVSKCGLSTGLDSGEPFWRRKMLKITVEAMAKIRSASSERIQKPKT